MQEQSYSTIMLLLLNLQIASKVGALLGLKSYFQYYSVISLSSFLGSVFKQVSKVWSPLWMLLLLYSTAGMGVSTAEFSLDRNYLFYS